MMQKLSVFLVSAAVSLSSLMAQELVGVPDECDAGVYNSPEYLLQGKIPGVKIGVTDGNLAGYLNTHIRGFNSTFSTSSPLWVVDGVVLSDCTSQIQDPFDALTYGTFNYSSKVSQLDFLNLYDIETIEVLRNVSETSKYGSRGANGVILITTKKGKTQKPSFVLHSNLGFPFSNGLTHNHDISLGYNQNKASLRLSAFYRDFTTQYVGGAGDRNGGARLNYDFRSNKNIWLGFNVFAAMGRQTLVSSAATYGVPTMGLAMQGVQIPDVLNSVEGWVNDHDDYADYFRSNGNIYLQLNFLKYCNWKTDVNFDINNSTRYYWYGLQTEFGKKFNRAAAIDATALFSYQVNTALNFERHIKVNHKVSATLSGSFYGDVNRFNKMSGDHFMTDALREKGFSLRESMSAPRHISRQYNTWSVGGDVSYTYRSYVGVGASCIADRQMRYDSQFCVYPSVNAWIDIREMVMQENEAISSLRLTGGWGKAGYRAYLPYQLTDRAIDRSLIDAALAEQNIVIDHSDPKTTLGNYFEGYDYGSSDEWNIGVRAAFLKNRISLFLGYYSKHTTETFTIFGFGKKRFEDSHIWKPCDRWELVSDSDEIVNRGFEGSVSANIISRPHFAWNASLNLASSGFDMHYILNDILKDFNPFPKLYGGFGSHFDVYGVSVGLQFNGAAGFDICNMTRMMAEQATELSADYVEKGDYLRLTNASIGYDIPMEKVKWIKNLRVSLTGTNLFTLTGYSGINPDVNVFGADGNKYSGIDYGALPLIRNILLGISVEF